MKIQTLTLTTLFALFGGGAVGIIIDSKDLLALTPPIVLGLMLAVGIILNAKGVLVFPEKEPYQDKG